MSSKHHILKVDETGAILVPKSLVQESDLAGEVDVLSEPGRIVMRATRRPRQGWAEAAQAMRLREQDRLLDAEE